ncbi:hypothetical protein CCAL13119_05205 [Campylobacter sp. RM13119]|nr:hypothetical protein [Campylobacter sp. RM13119]MBE3606358.1 hypothetical protein [Campylobacter sp. RM13119]
MQTLGGNSAHKNLNYKEDGLPVVFASNNGFYASIIDLTNGDINDMANKTLICLSLNQTPQPLYLIVL